MNSGPTLYGEFCGMRAEPFGSGSLANEFDFAGQQTDPTGLQYLRARYYDPASGVFLSREPLAVAPGWTGNPFGYGGANPARFVDPTGGRPVDSDGCEDGNEACYRRVQAESEAACAGLYFYTYTYCKEQLGGRNIFKDAYHWLACDGGLFGGSKCTDVLGVVVDGVTLLHGKNGLKSQQKRWKTNGLPEYESGKRVENMKEYEGLPPDFDLWFDADGNVYRAWQTGKNRVDFEKIGNVFDDVWK